MKKYLKVDFTKKRKIIFGLLVILFLSIAGWMVYSRYNQVLPQSAIYFLNDVPAPAQGQKVIVFSPHPDDETLAVGGYIYDAEKIGAEVRVVLITDGNKHGLKDKRYSEFRKATGMLGVKESDLVFLNHPDGRLKNENKEQLSNEFRKNIDEYKPDFIILPSSSDTHPDHAFAGKVVEEVLRSDNYDKPFLEYLVHYNHFPQPKKFKPKMFLLPPINLISFDKEWERYMLRDETERAKEDAVLVYRSQIKTPFLKSLMLSLIRKNELFFNSGGI